MIWMFISVINAYERRAALYYPLPYTQILAIGSLKF
jgi:hypothetical protein